MMVRAVSRFRRVLPHYTLCFSASASAVTPGLQNPTARKLPHRLLEYGVAGLVGATTYATVAYIAEQVREKRRAFSSSIIKPVVHAVFAFKNHQPVYSPTPGPIKAVKSYQRPIHRMSEGSAEPSSEKQCQDLDDKSISISVDREAVALAFAVAVMVFVLVAVVLMVMGHFMLERDTETGGKERQSLEMTEKEMERMREEPKRELVITWE